MKRLNPAEQQDGSARKVLENDLQLLIARQPHLLSPSEGGRWMLVAREVVVPAGDGSRRLMLDHLFLDGNGVPILVEVKLSGDTRGRREVVAQMLDYAAHATESWTESFLERCFMERCRAERRSPEEVIRASLGNVDADALWEIAERNLRSGRIRMVFATDTVSSELHAVANFLNSQFERAEVSVAEIPRCSIPKQDEATGARRSVLERLRALPAVFDLRDVYAGFGVSDAASRVMINRWKAAGMVEPVGPRTGIYYNLVADPKAVDSRRHEAIRRALPSAVIIGSWAASDGGWAAKANQHAVDVAVLKTRERRTHPQVYGVTLIERPKSWYGMIAPFMKDDGELTVLAPEAAVADAWVFGGGFWNPDPDDIHPKDDDWQERLLGALLAFGMDEDAARSRIGQIECYGSGA